MKDHYFIGSLHERRCSGVLQGKQCLVLCCSPFILFLSS